MNNGYTRESKHRIAVLEEEDVETFVAFCEYAYTGDYNVPQSPPPRQEETVRRGVAESVTSPAKSWRELHRSESMSSTVPPPAPSPPPESVQSSQIVQPREPEPVIEEDPPAEAAAEGEPTVEENVAAVEENDPRESEQVEEPTTEPATSDQVEPEPEPETIPEPETNTVPGNEFDEWEQATTELPKKAKKLGKKKKKCSKQPTEEPAVSLTPPSTPPPEASSEVHAALPAATDAETSEQPGNQDGEWWQEPSEAVEVGPKDETPYEAAPEPEPKPEQASEQEWEATAEAEHAPAEEGSGQAGWENNVDSRTEEQQEPEAPPKPFIDMSFAKQSQSDSSLRTPGQSMWEEFAALQYNDENLDSFLATPSSSTSDLPYLTFHAKVYVFATRYLIPALAQLCLRKLHRDLLSLSFENAEAMNPILESQPLGGLAALQAPMVLDVLQYAYTKTTRLEPISPTSATQLRENELRKLVVHFAACKVKELARYHLPGDSEATTPTVRPIDAKVERTGRASPKSLRVLLDMTPELASDLVYRMM